MAADAPGGKAHLLLVMFDRIYFHSTGQLREARARAP